MFFFTAAFRLTPRVKHVCKKSRSVRANPGITGILGQYFFPFHLWDHKNVIVILRIISSGDPLAIDYYMFQLIFNFL